jgi:hypothetical protein
VFDSIFERIVRSRSIVSHDGAAQRLRELCKEAGATELRACYPGDMCTIIEWIKRFEGEAVEILPGDLERAVALYFTRTVDGGGEDLSDS